MPDPLKDRIDGINKRFGSGTVMKMDGPITPIAVIPTGALSLDLALGVGGIPRGRVTEIYGNEMSGKTTIALHVIAEAQKAGGICLFIDAEHAFDPTYAQAIGVDLSKLLISQPDFAEQALEIADEFAESGQLALIVVDSVAALTPRAEIQGEVGDSHMGLQARLMGQSLRKMTGHLHKTNTAIIFINQLREKIGVVFGSPDVTPGGKALKFYASVRLDVRRKEQIKTDGEASGNLTLVKVVKNKVSPPFRTAEFDIVYGEGISKAGCVLDLAVAHGLIGKSGAWFADPETGEKLGQGREKAKAYLCENPVYMEDMAKKIMDKVR
jgi:recombination protein RecA